jgi:hypothetical protein
VTTAAEVIDRVRVLVAAERKSGQWGDLSPGRVEVGPVAHEAISAAAGWVSTHRARLLGLLYSLPVHTSRDIGPRHWCVIARDGTVIAEGDLTGP